MNLFGERVTEEVASEVGLSHTGAWWPLIQCDHCLYKEGDLDTDTRTQTGVELSQAKTRPEAGTEAGNRSFPSTCRGAWPCRPLHRRPAASTSAGQGFLMFKPVSSSLLRQA